MPCLKTSLDSEAPMAGQRGEVLSRLGLLTAASWLTGSCGVLEARHPPTGRLVN